MSWWVFLNDSKTKICRIIFRCWSLFGSECSRFDVVFCWLFVVTSYRALPRPGPSNMRSWCFWFVGSLYKTPLSVKFRLGTRTILPKIICLFHIFQFFGVFPFLLFFFFAFLCVFSLLFSSLFFSFFFCCCSKLFVFFPFFLLVSLSLPRTALVGQVE